MICWSCREAGGSGAALRGVRRAAAARRRGGSASRCWGCRARYAVDLAAAEAAYKELSRQVHPDRFATADPRARRASLARTVQLNEAWRTLKDPVRRAEYLLTRAGIDIGGKQPTAGVTRSGR